MVCLFFVSSSNCLNQSQIVHAENVKEVLLETFHTVNHRKQDLKCVCDWCEVLNYLSVLTKDHHHSYGWSGSSRTSRNQTVLFSVPVAEKRLMDVKLGELGSWLGARDFTPNGIIASLRRGEEICWGWNRQNFTNEWLPGSEFSLLSQIKKCSLGQTDLWNTGF